MEIMQKVTMVDLVDLQELLLMVSLIDMMRKAMATEISVEVKLTKQLLCHYKI